MALSDRQRLCVSYFFCVSSVSFLSCFVCLCLRLSTLMQSGTHHGQPADAAAAGNPAGTGPQRI